MRVSGLFYTKNGQTITWELRVALFAAISTRDQTMTSKQAWICLLTVSLTIFSKGQGTYVHPNILEALLPGSPRKRPLTFADAQITFRMLEP